MEGWRTQDEIDEQINRTSTALDSGQSRWPGMTYEQGVDAALRWVTFESSDAPMEDE